MTIVTIGNGVMSIGFSAFYECGNLTTVTMGDSITSIGESAFFNCNSLITVYYLGGEENWRKVVIGAKNDKLKNATIRYYSETQPTDNGNYWHYDTDGKTPVAWKKEN